MSDKHRRRLTDGTSLPAAPPRTTPREREILGLIAEGLTDREIARRLWVSVNTVQTHQAHLREKLQVRNRVALLHAAARPASSRSARQNHQFQ